ncbi:hypothetical protein WH221_08295 [Chryseobacterium culicis]|uniref:Uncharacterized protein n=1 Tax=Chryseobacterium culicis TaxID=680127 RepID=A0A2S9D0J3_CHRCI|nr:hypothetical protein [Chryseobacterium culicis]PRB86236.1 hypothetical protein CQ022_08290 [Chryseobacterium culicis]PRB91989.1 hypothetical protein CQ033_01960 [Chryseobacterium culicis]
MKKFILEKFNIILLVLTLGLIIFCMVDENLWVKKMLKSPKYTIGEAVTDWHPKNNNGVGTDYKYQVSNKIYFKTTNYSYKKGDKFLIIFDSIKPKNAKVLGIYSIENYLIDLKVPSKGWKYQDVPFNIDSNTIKKYLQDWNVEPFEYIQQ